VKEKQQQVIALGKFFWNSVSLKRRSRVMAASNYVERRLLVTFGGTEPKRLIVSLSKLRFRTATPGLLRSSANFRGFECQN
jgi:hypothetical protein